MLNDLRADARNNRNDEIRYKKIKSKILTWSADRITTAIRYSLKKSSCPSTAGLVFQILSIFITIF